VPLLLASQEAQSEGGSLQAREDKIKYHSKGRKTFVPLTHEEHQIFKELSGGFSSGRG
jgi:hypothetical protein